MSKDQQKAPADENRATDAASPWSEATRAHFVNESRSYMQHATKDSYPLILARSFALIALFAVPLSTAGVNIAATLFAVCALLSPEVWRNWRSLFTDRVSVAA